MKRILFIGLYLSTTLAFGQSGKLSKADKLFDNLSYAYAANLYEELLGSDLDTPALKVSLGRSYYYMGDMKNAEKYLEQVVNSEVAENNDIFFYAQALKQNGKIELSDKWMNSFRNTSGTDLRSDSYSQNPDYRQNIIGKGLMFEIKNLDINTEKSDFGGYPSTNGKTYFVSNRRERAFVKNIWTWNKSPYHDLYEANVDSNRDLKDPQLLERKVNSKWHEGPLCFGHDGKVVYFTRNNVAKGKNREDNAGHQNLKMYRAEIDAEGTWTNEKEVHFNSKDYSVGHPTITTDGKTMYFVSDLPGGHGGADIYRCEIKPDGSLGSPINLGKDVNTEGQEMFPWVNEEGTIFFSSNGHIGMGGLDVFAIFPNVNDYSKMVNVGLPINSQADDFAFTMNTDGKTGYFSSNRKEGGKGDDDIYSYILLAPLKPSLILKGVITDVRNKKILPGAIVDLMNEKGEIIASTVAGDNGSYSFDLEPELDYTVKAANQDYFGNQGNVSTKNLSKGTEELEKDVTLEKDPGLSLYALVTDVKTSNPLDSVTMTVTDNMTGKVVQIITNETGDYLRPLSDKKLDDRGSYNIGLSRPGYFPKTVTYNTVFDKEGQYDVHANLDLGMDPMVTDLAQLIEINPINFDLNKSIIRPDAKVELDKIVEVMNKYPLMEVELGSHTDCRASRAYNEKLSDRRAKASAAYIKTKITNPDRIYGKGYGEAILLNGCECEGSLKSDCSEEEHEKNRRTEFKVISVGDPNVGVKNNSTDSFGND